MIEKYKEISGEIKYIENINKESRKLKKDIFEYKKYYIFCLKLFGVLNFIPIFISISGFLEIEFVFAFIEYFNSLTAMKIVHFPFAIMMLFLFFPKKINKKSFFRLSLFSIVSIFIYYSIVSPSFFYFISIPFLFMAYVVFYLMKSQEKYYSKTSESSEEKLALLEKERSLIIDKIMNNSEYLQKLLSNKEEDKTMREIYSNITKEKEWKEQLLNLSKKESIDCLENT
tara:strand:- start:16248 stop:16931 length:684 start_codon:yes stop_codon:yes gene_type:complete